MCGRYSFRDYSEDSKAKAIVSMMERDYPGQYKLGEIYPGDTAPAVINTNNKLLPVPATFGFPGFQGNKLIINARSETAAEKKMFADSLKDRRVVLPADGFFEWSRDDKKTKYLFTLESLQTIYLCGVYKIIEGKYRFVILTRPANESMIEILSLIHI